MKEASNSIPAGRLQRAASSQETYISKFRQVLARHGLTMASIAIICLLLPSIQSALLSSLDNLFRNPLKYLLWSLAVATAKFQKSCNVGRRYWLCFVTVWRVQLWHIWDIWDT